MAESLGRVIAELREPERQGADRGYTVRRFEFTTPGRMPEGAQPAGVDGAARKTGGDRLPDPLSRGSRIHPLFNAMKPMRDSLQRIVQRASGLDMIDLDSLSRASREHGAEVAVTLRNSVQVMAHFQARADSAVLQVMIRPPGLAGAREHDRDRERGGPADSADGGAGVAGVEAGLHDSTDAGQTRTLTSTRAKRKEQSAKSRAQPEGPEQRSMPLAHALFSLHFALCALLFALSPLPYLLKLTEGGQQIWLVGQERCH